MKRVIYFLVLLLMSANAWAQNVKIIASGGLNQMDINWNTVATAMGYTSSVVPQTTLNTNTFFTTTQVLVVSCGTNNLTATQVSNIQAFLETGKGVYLQSEYLSLYSGNIAFAQIVNALGGNFTWGATQNDSLAPSITGSLSTLTNAVSYLPYFWFGCTGSSNTCRVIPFVFNGNIPMGWMYDPSNTAYGRLITTSDQDWCGGGFTYAQSPLLMKNILYHLVHQDQGDTTNYIHVTKSVSICSGQLPYVWNGVTVTAGGTGVATFNTTSSGGCDSITTLNLTVGTSTVVNKTITICSGQLPYVWNGITVNAAGTNVATYTTTTASGCDSTTHLNLIVGANITATQNITICFNQLPYSWHGQTITAGGSAVATFSTPNASGCDSITTLNLTVNPVITVTKNITICNGQLPYTWNGIVVTAGGNAAATYTTTSLVTGCDSTTTLNLTVHQVISTTKNITICNSQLPYTWNGIVVTAGGNAAATYTATSLVTACDSTTTLNLTVHQVISTTKNITICNSQLPYSWNGINVTAGGNAAATYTTTSLVTACDSTTTLNLSVQPVITATKNITICNSQLPYTWNGIVVAAAGNAAATYTTTSLVTACDSTTTLNLSVQPVITITKNITICNSQLPYSWNGINVTAGGNAAATYTTTSLVTACDSTTTLNLSVQPVITASQNITICAGQLPYNWHGNIITAGGNAVATFTTSSLVTACDSTTTLNLTVHPVITTTKNITICNSQLPYSWNGINVTAGGNAAATYTTTSLVTACDSTTTLNLTVQPVITATKNITICNSQLPYSWNGINVTAGGNAAATYTTTSLVTACDSTTTLNLSVQPVITASQNITICAGQLPYNWHGNIITAGGNAVATFTTSSMLTTCDSTTTLNLVVTPVLTSTQSVTICADQLPYLWHGNSIAAGGNAVASYTTTASVSGCDSIITLNLIVNPLKFAIQNVSICIGQLPYSWNGFNLTAAGNAVAVYHTPSLVTGCDSTTTLNLTVNPLKFTTRNTTICAGQLPYLWNGITITTGGNAVATYTTPSLMTGCDSTTTLNLTVNSIYNGTVSHYICHSQVPYIFAGQNLTQSGSYTHTFTGNQGCDSIVHLNLTVAPAPLISGPIVVSNCNAVLFEGHTYTQNVVLTDTFFNSHGCDSVYRTVNITVLMPSNTVIEADICTGETYTFDGLPYQASGSFTNTYTGNGGCDSVRTLHLEVHDMPVVKIAASDYPKICIGDVITFTASGAVKYEWFLDSHLISTDDPALLYLPGVFNTFIVKGYSSFNCMDTASISIKAEDCCGIMIPNAFSPNGDGLNDKFGAITEGHPKFYKLFVFDRWGKKIFESYNINDQWDGTINGRRADLDVYFFMLQSECTDGSIFNKKGDVTLIR